MLKEDSEHFLLILSDSALPIGSFAYSSGLESFSVHRSTDVTEFLLQSLRGLAWSTIPFMLAVHQNVSNVVTLDDELDATLSCQIARRASLAQGRALVKLLDQCFAKHCNEQDKVAALQRYKSAINAATAHGHLGVAFALAGTMISMEVDRLIYAFLHAHAKAILSAAVRLSLLGPYQSTAILASKEVRKCLSQLLEETRHLEAHQATQTFSILDIYQGRHELLYSRIFSA